MVASWLLTTLLAGAPNLYFEFRTWENAVPAEVRRIIDDADRLEAFRLGALPTFRYAYRSPGKTALELDTPGDFARDLFRRSAGRGDGVLKYPVLAEYVAPPRDVLTRLRSTLATGNYGQFGKLCGRIRPGVGFRFTSPRGTAELLVCFGCKEADLVVGDLVVRLQIDEVSDLLAWLALELFPLDEALVQ